MNIRITLPAIIFLLFTAIHFTLAQESYFTISGKIIDSETSKPVPFANVGIAGKTIGTVSNEEGAFVFKVPAIYQNDSLKVSFIGYQTFTKPIAALKGQPINISLKPATVALDEVLVQARRKSALDILKEALAAVPANYDTSATQMMAFYQEET
jgi:hypothetical protein